MNHHLWLGCQANLSSGIGEQVTNNKSNKPASDTSFILIFRLVVSIADDQAESVYVLEGKHTIAVDQTLLAVFAEEHVEEKTTVERQEQDREDEEELIYDYSMFINMYMIKIPDPNHSKLRAENLPQHLTQRMLLS